MSSQSSPVSECSSSFSLPEVPAARLGYSSDDHTLELKKPSGGAGQPPIVHPYARLYAKTQDGKRRKIWNHALEKSLFSTYELYGPSRLVSYCHESYSPRSSLGAPQRRTIYMASLEAHIDRLHTQLLRLVGFFLISFRARSHAFPASVTGLSPSKTLNPSKDSTPRLQRYGVF